MLHTATTAAREIEALIDALDPMALNDYDVILRDVGNGLIAVTILAADDVEHHFAFTTLQ
jgi:hypothetical protein